MVKTPTCSEWIDTGSKWKVLSRQLQIWLRVYATTIGSRVMRSSVTVTSSGDYFATNMINNWNCRTNQMKKISHFGSLLNGRNGFLVRSSAFILIYSRQQNSFHLHNPCTNQLTMNCWQIMLLGSLKCFIRFHCKQYHFIL